MKSEVFNGQRFWSYFKYDATQMWRNHAKAAVIIGLSGLFFYFTAITFGLLLGDGWDGPNIATRFLIFIIAFTVLELYQTRTYGYLTDRKRGSAWLMVPASAFEKWLSMLLMTLIVIPVLFLVVFFSADFLTAVLDPTVGKSMISTLTGKASDINSELVILNETYSTSWGIGSIAWPVAMSFLSNLLYFLLCGLCFKRNKILGAIAVSIGISMVLSLIFSGLGSFGPEELETMVDETPASVQTILRWCTAITSLVAAGLSAGIYYRLKTLKH